MSTTADARWEDGDKIEDRERSYEYEAGYLHRLLSNGAYLLTVLDPAGVILYQSPSVERLLGHRAEEMVGKSAFDYVHPDDRERVLHIFARNIETPGPGTTLRFRVRHTDGVWQRVEATGNNLLSDPEVRGFLVEARTLSEEERRSREVRLLQRAFSLSATAFVLTDTTVHDNPIVYANRGFEEMTGYSTQEVLGRNCRFLQGADRHQPAIDELRAAVAAGRECKVMLRNYRKDGTLFWNELHVSPVRDEKGQITNFLGVQHDVTRRVASRHAQQDSPYPSLTPRELDVLSLVSTGKTNSQIASELLVSLGTVKMHIQHILAKLEVPDRTGAAVRAGELGLLPPAK